MNKYYAKKPTKRRAKANNKTKLIFIVLLLAVMIGNCLYTAFLDKKVSEVVEYTQIELEAQGEAIKGIESIIMIELLTNNVDVETQIREIALEENFRWTDYLIRLAFCESSLDPTKTNSKGNYPVDSYDRGLFQFNSYWQARVSDECAYDLDCATRETIKMINNGQQGLWTCDDKI